MAGRPLVDVIGIARQTARDVRKALNEDDKGEYWMQLIVRFSVVPNDYQVKISAEGFRETGHLISGDTVRDTRDVTSKRVALVIPDGHCRFTLVTSDYPVIGKLLGRNRDENASLEKFLKDQGRL